MIITDLAMGGPRRNVCGLVLMETQFLKMYTFTHFCLDLQKASMISLKKCLIIILQNLNIKSSDKGSGRTFNRLCNNVWNRNLVVNKLKMLSVIYVYELVEVNPVYSSFIGNLLYGSENTPDMIASSIEIARRGFKKNILKVGFIQSSVLNT